MSYGFFTLLTVFPPTHSGAMHYDHWAVPLAIYTSPVEDLRNVFKFHRVVGVWFSIR